MIFQRKLVVCKIRKFYWFHILFQKPIIIMLDHYSKLKRSLETNNEIAIYKGSRISQRWDKNLFPQNLREFLSPRSIPTFHSRSIALSCVSQFIPSDYDQSLPPSLYELIGLREFHRHSCIRWSFKKKWKFLNIITSLLEMQFNQTFIWHLLTL